MGRSEPFGATLNEKFDIAAKSFVLLICLTAFILLVIFLVKYYRKKPKTKSKSALRLSVIFLIIFISTLSFIMSPFFQPLWFWF